MYRYVLFCVVNIMAVDWQLTPLQHADKTVSELFTVMGH